MFLNRRKSHETAGEDASMSDDVKKKKGKKETATGENDDALVAEIAGLEEMVNRRTRELEAAKTQLHQLQDSPGIPEELKKEVAAEELLTRPNKARKAAVAPVEEVTVEEEGEKSKKGTDKTLEKADASKAEKGQAAGEQEHAQEPAGGESDDFFGAEEEEENRLAGLIASLPEVSIAEILCEAEEVKALAKEWLPKKEGTDVL